MAKKENTQLISPEININESDFKVFKEASGDKPIQFIKGCVESYLHEYANGGLMLTAGEVDRINKASKGAVKSSEEVITAVEKANKVSKGHDTFEVSIDPSMVEMLENEAFVQGLTVKEYIQMQWGHYIANGWLTGTTADLYWVPLSIKDMKKISSITGSEVVTSGDVLALVKEKVAV